MSFNPEYLHGRPIGPEGPGDEAKREDLREFAAHRGARSGSSALGGILILAGAVALFVATFLDSYLANFRTGHTLLSVASALRLWGPVALLLVAGVLALTSARLTRAVAGGLAVGVAAVALLYPVSFLLSAIYYDSTVGWAFYLDLIGSAVALAGGLIALLTARTKT